MNVVLTTLVKKVWNALAAEPAVTLAVIVAAVNATTVHTWQGYATAVAVAVFRFAVSPAIPTFTLTPKK